MKDNASEYESFQLIDGTFSVSESKEIITSIFSSKIQFHLMKTYSSMERFGHEDPASMNRITELKKNLADFLSVINNFEDSESKLEISSTIQIKNKI